MDNVRNQNHFSWLLLISMCCQRGAVVDWLERLNYGAESRQKVVSSRLGFAI